MLLQYSILIAETRMSDLGGRYQQQVAAGGGVSPGILVAAGIVLLIAVGVGIFIARKPKIENSPAGLLNEICGAHGIGGPGTRLLNEIASTAGLQHPALIVLGPTHFDAAIELASSKLKLDGKNRKTLGLIRRQVFGC